MQLKRVVEKKVELSSEPPVLGRTLLEVLKRKSGIEFPG